MSQFYVAFRPTLSYNRELTVYIQYLTLNGYLTLHLASELEDRQSMALTCGETFMLDSVDEGQSVAFHSHDDYDGTNMYPNGFTCRYKLQVESVYSSVLYILEMEKC